MNTTALANDPGTKKTLAICSLRDAAEAVRAHAVVLSKLQTLFVLRSSRRWEKASVRNRFKRRRFEAIQFAKDVQREMSLASDAIYGVDAALIEGGHEVPALTALRDIECCCMACDYRLHSFIDGSVSRQADLLWTKADEIDRIAGAVARAPEHRTFDAQPAPVQLKSPDDADKAAEPNHVKLPPLPQHAMTAWKLKNVLGMKTQQEIAAQLAKEVGYTGGQGGVSRMLRIAQQHIDATHDMDLIALSRKSDPARNMDPHRIELGQRRGGRSQHRREQAKQNARETD